MMRYLCSLLALAPACAPATDAAGPQAAEHEQAPEALGPHGQPLVHLEAAAREHLDLAFARAAASTHANALRAHARVVDDPARRTTLRAPIAGRWVTAANAPALALGARFDSGAEFGTVKPRLSAVERSDAATKLAQARADANAAQSALDASTKALARAEALNADDKNASDRAVEEARARKEQDAARLAGAQENAHVLEALLAPTAEAGAALPLRLARGGELVELFARPGEEVDAGAALLTVADFGELRVRVDVPPAFGSAAAPAELRLTSAFDARASWSARFAGPDSDALRASAVSGWIYALDNAVGAPLRPGAPLEAWIPAGEARAGWSVPDAAVVRFGGRAWVYLKGSNGAFERVPLVLDEPIETTPNAEGGGWFTRAAWAGEAELVVRGAQALLSVEIIGAQSAAGEEE
ncbi:MAG: hypothetical protein HZA53_11800 [Planctomycetes bacterium]|nr:hypothetical protein [Planctomycetota bacterium]